MVEFAETELSLAPSSCVALQQYADGATTLRQMGWEGAREESHTSALVARVRVETREPVGPGRAEARALQLVHEPCHRALRRAKQQGSVRHNSSRTAASPAAAAAAAAAAAGGGGGLALPGERGDPRAAPATSRTHQRAAELPSSSTPSPSRVPRLSAHIDPSRADGEPPRSFSAADSARPRLRRAPSAAAPAGGRLAALGERAPSAAPGAALAVRQAAAAGLRLLRDVWGGAQDSTGCGCAAAAMRARRGAQLQQAAARSPSGVSATPPYKSLPAPQTNHCQSPHKPAAPKGHCHREHPSVPNNQENLELCVEEIPPSYWSSVHL